MLSSLLSHSNTTGLVLVLPPGQFSVMVFAAQDAWRKHPVFANCHKNPLPNLRLAVVIFAGIVVADSLYTKINGE